MRQGLKLPFSIKLQGSAMDRPSSEIYHIGYRSPPGRRAQEQSDRSHRTYVLVDALASALHQDHPVLGAGIFLLHAGWLFFQLLGEKVASNINTPPGTLTPEMSSGALRKF